MPGGLVSPGRVELCRGDEQRARQVGAAQIRPTQVSTGEVGRPQVGAAQVGTDEQGTAQIRPAQVGSGQPTADQVGAAVVGAPPQPGPGRFAGPLQQRVDPSPVGVDVQRGQLVGAQFGEPAGLGEGVAEPVVLSRRAGQAHRLGEQPEQLVQLAHDGQRREHRPGQLRLSAPVPSAERDLGDLLARAEAVEHHAPAEAAFPQVVVDAAAEVAAQVGAGPSGGLVDGEVRRLRERGRDTAQAGATRTVGAQGPVPRWIFRHGGYHRNKSLNVTSDNHVESWHLG
ncbi:hypothetical protein KRM28CT15_60690 [Krasilnikovia sp. M28-CT-15]